MKRVSFRTRARLGSIRHFRSIGEGESILVPVGIRHILLCYVTRIVFCFCFLIRLRFGTDGFRSENRVAGEGGLLRRNAHGRPHLGGIVRWLTTIFGRGAIVTKLTLPADIIVPLGFVLFLGQVVHAHCCKPTAVGGGAKLHCGVAAFAASLVLERKPPRRFRLKMHDICVQVAMY